MKLTPHYTLSIGCDSQMPTSSNFRHDPVMIKQDSKYLYLVHGHRYLAWSSTDFHTTEKLPGFLRPAHLGYLMPSGFKARSGPPISDYQTACIMIRTVSAFGKNHSPAARHNQTLDPRHPPILNGRTRQKSYQSVPGPRCLNAIDSQLVIRILPARLAFFGSWSGIKTRHKRNATFTAPARTAGMVGIAARRPIRCAPIRRPANTAIRAPFLLRSPAYDYFFRVVGFWAVRKKAHYR